MASFPAMAHKNVEIEAFRGFSARPKIILPEIEWRKRPVRGDLPDEGHSVTRSRWTVKKPVKPLEMCANHSDDSHLITFPLVPSSVEFFVAGRQIASGTIRMDTVLITGPGEPSRTIFTETFDCVRVYLS